MHRPLFFPLIALIAGILSGDRCFVDGSYSAVAALVVLSGLLMCIRTNKPKAAFVLVLCLMFIIGPMSMAKPQTPIHHSGHIVHLVGSGKISIEGTVYESEQISPMQAVLMIRCVRVLKDQTYHAADGNIRLSVPAGLNFGYGDFIRFRTTVKNISGFHNPGGFRYDRYMNRQGIYASGYISCDADIVLIRRNAGNPFWQFLTDYRLNFKQLLQSNARTPEREILEAMTLGNQKNIPQDVRDHFSQTGTSHILSISGLHVSMVASAAYFLMLLLLKSSEYLMLRFSIIKIAAAASLIPVFLYGLIAGMGAPVLRSTIMALAFLTAMMLGKIRDLYNILYGAALMILVWSPEALFDISFQLSFSAVMALIYIVPRFSGAELSFLESAHPWIQSIFRRIYLLLLVSVAATAGTLPIIVYYFHQISTVTLMANLICVPLLGMVTLIPALAAMLMAPVTPFLAGWFIKVASFFTGIGVDIVNRLAAVPGSFINFVEPRLPEMLLYYIVLLLLIHIFELTDQKNDTTFVTRHRGLLKGALLLAVLLIFADITYWYIRDQHSREMTITALDVGQGSSTLVEYPGGIRMLIDGGGFPDSAFDMGKFVIAPFLHFKRIRNLDIVVLTHPHPDHLQGLIYIINNFNVKEIWTTGAQADDDLCRLWEKTIFNYGIKVRKVSSQTPPQRISGAKVEFLWPDSPARDFPYPKINDASLVMKICFGNHRFLVTGDISSDVEYLLISSGINLKSDLLFVPHHGSVHSSSRKFIHAVSPKYAIVSSGKNNVFRHPHPDVLNRYRDSGTLLSRTDLQGAIMAQTNGQSIEITTWLK